VECDFVDDVGVYVASGCVIVYDPREALLDNQLGEDHVGVSILYCLNNVLVVMMIWKWPLVQMILNGYPLRQLFMSYNENNIPIIDEEEEIGVAIYLSEEEAKCETF
jgi:hypothetical protein